MRVNTNVFVLLAVLIIVIGLGDAVRADEVSLFTDTCPYILDPDPQTNPYPDTNWDWWQQEDPNVIEEAIYLCAYDGASGHLPCPNSPIDGNVDGCYSTLYMGSGGGDAPQSLGVSGTDPNEFPDNQRDTRVMPLFNLSKIKQVNDKAGAILNCVFRCSCDKVSDWSRQGQNDLQAPTKLYVSIFGADEQGYWCHPPDSNSEPNIPISELQDEFDGELNTEKEIDIQVGYSPWWQEPNEPMLQPLTQWYIAEYGPQFYEMDFTEEIRQILDANSELEWIGLAIRPSLDGEVVYLKLSALECLYYQGHDKPIPPTLDVQVSKYLGDLDDDGDVDLVDFAIFAQQWEQSSGLLIADLNVDGTVDIADLGALAGNWLKGKE